MITLLKHWKKWRLRAGLGLAGLLLIAQAFNPARTNPPVIPGGDITATNPPPPEVTALLHKACYDCHSQETTWPWYAHISPVSWLVADDVYEGRKHLNFSQWPHSDPGHAARKLDHISEALDDKDMPPAKYTLIHGNARLTEVQRQLLITWADATANRLKAADTNN